MSVGKPLFGGVGNVEAGQNPSVGRLRGVIRLAVAGASAGFLLDLQRGTEAIL